MVPPWKDPWGLSPSLRPWEAWTVVTDVSGRFRPVGTTRSRVRPMLAVYATATVVVTVEAGTRCAWHGLTGSLHAEKSLPGPGT